MLNLTGLKYVTIEPFLATMYVMLLPNDTTSLYSGRMKVMNLCRLLYAKLLVRAKPGQNN